MRSEYSKYRHHIEPAVVEAVQRLGLPASSATGSRITHRQFQRNPFKGEFWLDFGTDEQKLLVSWEVGRFGHSGQGVKSTIHVRKP